MSKIARNPKLISYLNMGLVLDEVRPVRSAPVNELCLPQKGCTRLKRDPVTGKLPKPFDVIVFGKNIIKPSVQAIRELITLLLFEIARAIIINP